MLLTATLTLATSLSIQVELPEETGMERVSARDHLLAERDAAMESLEAELTYGSELRIAPAMFQEDSSASVAKFGSEGSMRWGLLGGWGIDVKHSSNNEMALGAKWEYFIVDGFAFAPELKLWGFFQDGGDAFGGSLDLLFAWHFIQRDTWSLFADGGVGLLGTTKNVPIDGSEFNFSPQVGGGITFDIGNNNRWVIGARWQHISNAGLYSNNPGRDNIYVYTGINFPF